MTDLPRPLRKWRQVLSVFPDELAEALGRCVARLAPAFESLSARRVSFDGELDGYEGIARRGPYERLLTTEWALQKAAPAEFLRRAANDEHLFLNLVKKEPAAPRGTMVLFDSGPDQVGAPRIVQLAILVIAAERAARLSEGFAWQLVHHLGEPLLSTVDAQSVRTFLASRTALRSSSVAVEEWQKACGRATLWLVGSPRLTDTLGNVPVRVGVAERIQSQGVVDVSVASSGRAQRSVTLEVPAQKTAVRLLRDPFDSARSERSLEQLPRPDANFLFTPAGGRLFYRDVGGRLASVAVPNSPRASPGTPKKHEAPSGVTIVGVARHGNKMTWLGLAKGVIVIDSIAPIRRGAPSRLICPGPMTSPDAGAEIWPVLVFPAEFRVVFVAPDRSLWRVDLNTRSVELVAEGVRAVAPFKHGGLVAVDRFRDDHGEATSVLLAVKHSHAARMFYPKGNWGSAFLRVLSSDPMTWAVAYEEAPGLFRIEARGARQFGVGQQNASSTELARSVTLNVPTGCRAVGVDWAGTGSAALGLYFLGDDDKHLFVAGRGRSRTLVKSSATITRVAVTTGSHGLVAYSTADGEIGFVERSGKVRWKGRLEDS